MKNLTRIIITVLVAGAAMFSCEKPAKTPTEVLSLSESSKTVAADGVNTSLTIVSKVDWTLSVSTDSDWTVTPSVTKGWAGTTMVRFTFPKNTSEQTRTATATITAAGRTEPYTFTITQNSVNVPSGVNGWILEQLKGWYYWNDEVKALSNPPSGTLAYDAFLKATIEALPWAKVQDTSNGENPATIDGEYTLDQNGNLVTPLTRRAIYSYVERTGPGTRAADGMTKTFGFNVVPVGFSGSDRIGYLVLLVQPDSPADKAGMKRGMWILEYNGAPITQSDYLNFQYQLLWFEGGDTMNFAIDTDGDISKDKTLSVTAVEMKASPIIHHEVMTTTGGKKVAYLFFNEFEWGAQQSNGTFEFENDLRKVFGEFKNAGASELVLDLRYNPGGYVHTCQILTSLIGNVSTTDVFAKSLRNDDIQEAWSAAGYSGTIDNPQIDHFVNEPNSLKLSKVYILATRSSASASEMVINALRGADVDVVHIGERTNGKNVGMDLLETTIDDYSYQMRPITFKILNAKDFTDYANGFAPNHLVDELDEVLGVKDARLHEFGNPEELLLEKALGLIDPAMARSAGRAGVTRAPGERTMQPLRVLRDSRKGGAIYVQGARIE